MTGRNWFACLAIFVVGYAAMLGCRSGSPSEPSQPEETNPSQPGAGNSAQISGTNLRQLGLALHSYVTTMDSYLPKNDHLSWRVHLLPFVDENELYKQFKLDKPWDDPDNLKLLSKMPKVYQLPGLKLAKPGFTYYQSFVGKGAFIKGRDERDPGTDGPARSINYIFNADGASNVVAVVETAEPIEWTRPDDIPFDKKKPLPQFGGHHKNGKTLILMVDGAVRSPRANLTEKEWRQLIDYDDKLTPDFEESDPEPPGSSDPYEVSKKNLAKLVLAMHHYHNDENHFPPNDNLSWRVHLLPYLGQRDLYKRFHLDKAWNHPDNLSLLEKMPKIYELSGLKPSESGFTYYQSFVGEGAFLKKINKQGPPDRKPFRDLNQFRDFEKVVLVEHSEAIEWTNPHDIPFAKDTPLPRFGGHHPNGKTLIVMVDGKVHVVSPKWTEKDWRALISYMEKTKPVLDE